MHSQVELQRQEVRTARYNFLVAALGRDQNSIAQTKKVPSVILKKIHLKQVKAIAAQADLAEKAIVAYVSMCLRVVRISKTEQAAEKITTMAADVVPIPLVS